VATEGVAYAGDREGEGGVNLGLQSNGKDMQMVFIKASCDCGGDDYGYWFLSALTLSCTLLAVYQIDLLLCKSPLQLSRASRTHSQNSFRRTFLHNVVSVEYVTGCEQSARVGCVLLAHLENISVINLRVIYVFV
jgi:hypothetical protein